MSVPGPWLRTTTKEQFEKHDLQTGGCMEQMRASAESKVNQARQVKQTKTGREHT